MVYEPREDSFLMGKVVEELASGKVLDIGCGSGIQGKAALETGGVASVAFADIDGLAVSNCNDSIDDEKAEFIVSDLFENIEGRFDTIIFNPPYLPDDGRVKDIALDGGKEGWELIERFLGQAKAHLAEKGIILLLISTFTNKEKVEGLMKERSFTYAIVAEQKMEFETLYVYRIEDD